MILRRYHCRYGTWSRYFSDLFLSCTRPYFHRSLYTYMYLHFSLLHPFLLSPPSLSIPLSLHLTLTASEDYESITQTLGPFNQTHRRLCVDVAIMNDMVCEADPYPEYFMATMVSSNENVTVGLKRTAVFIEDRGEPECG